MCVPVIHFLKGSPVDANVKRVYEKGDKKKGVHTTKTIEWS